MRNAYTSAQVLGNGSHITCVAGGAVNDRVWDIMLVPRYLSEDELMEKDISCTDFVPPQFDSVKVGLHLYGIEVHQNVVIIHTLTKKITLRFVGHNLLCCCHKPRQSYILHTGNCGLRGGLQAHRFCVSTR
jgi:hypothetical protein